MIKDRVEFKNGSKGYFINFCPQCGYAIENCALTANLIACPLCSRAGRVTKLEPRQVITWPKHEVKKVAPPS